MTSITGTSVSAVGCASASKWECDAKVSLFILWYKSHHRDEENMAGPLASQDGRTDGRTQASNTESISHLTHKYPSAVRTDRPTDRSRRCLVPQYIYMINIHISRGRERVRIADTRTLCALKRLIAWYFKSIYSRRPPKPCERAGACMYTYTYVYMYIVDAHMQT